MNQAVGYRPLTSDVRVQFQASACGICFVDVALRQVPFFFFTSTPCPLVSVV
jgi:hypothetical protein